MGRLADVVEFADKLQRVATTEELFPFIENFALQMGFKYFALGHHVDYRAQPDNVALIHNYPSLWVDYFRENDLYYFDPVLQASERAAVGFSWSSLPQLIDVTEKQRWVMEAAAGHGVAHGFTIPVHVPGEPSGSCSFVAPKSGRISKEARMQAQLAGAFAFEAARRLVLRKSGGLGGKTPMTERQRECVILAARGNTDSQIAGALGIGIETVKMHLKVARERYGVSKRMTLAVRALQEGQIAFCEVLNTLPPFGEWANGPIRR